MNTLRVRIFGASLDTGNLGVSALGIATVRGLFDAAADLSATLYDDSPGRETVTLLAGPWSVSIERAGCAFSRRIYLPGNLRQLDWAARLGLSRLHPRLREMRAAHGILDVSGGDSFTDLYGDWRFRSVVAPKQLALRLGVPLILLPQTYGPFAEPAHRSIAREVLNGARQVWTRDLASLEVVRELLGSAFDPARHRSGVDVAFGLPVRTPAALEPVERLTSMRHGDGPLFGLNVSGLLYLDESQAARFGLRSSYRAVVTRVIRRLLEEPGARILLVPHVVAPCHPHEDDWAACMAAARAAGAGAEDRIWVAPPLADPMEVKWLIGHCDWMCGARMHACIAALSQAIPTLGLAYSDKSAGVFASVGAESCVADLRRLDADELVQRIDQSLAERGMVARRLRASLPAIEAQLREQFDSIVGALRSTRPHLGPEART